MTTRKKSHVIRLLEAHHVSYEAYTYATDIRSAANVAAVLGVPVDEIYKTLVVLPPHGKPLLLIIPGPSALDLKRWARALGEKKLRMATQRQAEELTGLQVGGISALALLDRGFRVYVDRVAQTRTAFIVSAGQRGMNVRLRVADFMEVTGARFVDASIDSGSTPGVRARSHKPRLLEHS
ncbi:MAG TPA: YbaK/EbsC family protein [Candidatus Tectomicrobia bacterium]|nr:YbaK/EbsC family protein [Candidatus Tectomicrobia bacterium]